jgi:predicted glutamine amidotransferase
MGVLRYNDLITVEDFLNNIFMESVLESSEILTDTYLSKLGIHKKLLDEYKDILPGLNKITNDLIKNSGLKIDLNTFNTTLFSLASLSNCILSDAKFLIDNSEDFSKAEYEKELRSILEELKLNGIGNELVRNLSNFYSMIINMSSNIFQKRDIHDSLKPKNLLNAVDDYIKRNKITFDTFVPRFEKLFNLIAKYVKNGYLDKFKSKLSNKILNTGTDKVLRLDELNK